MRFWMRELAGWVLIGLGLYAFYLSYRLLVAEEPGHYIVEAGPVTFIGFILFRGGIHLLKVAVAARICLQAQDRLRTDRSAARPRPRPAVTGRAR
jgi:hypothetical protein